MLKAADALYDAGYAVRVVCTNHLPWAKATDEEVRRTRAWPVTVVDYSRASAQLNYLRSGVRFHVAQKIINAFGTVRCPLALVGRAYGRVHSEMVRAVLADPADLIYGGTTGALAAVAEAGRRSGRPYALDLEDFYSAEQSDSPGTKLAHSVCVRIERAVLPEASFLTAGSPAIAESYAARYGLNPIPIHNTFPLPSTQPNLTPSPGEGLRLYWFSQTVGPGRGLEDAIRAMGVADIPGELHLRGRAIIEYMASLQRLTIRVAPRLRIIHHEPAPPDLMVDLCQGYDVGLAVEPGFSPNNRIALSNKAFTYMLAGLAVAFTDTPGQRPLALDMREGALLYAPGDVHALASGLTRWASNKALLAKAKAAAWAAAQRRWHWEHPLERGALLAAVERIFA
jgi:hypothetical protein